LLVGFEVVIEVMTPPESRLSVRPSCGPPERPL
jgi:hypothetical protein